MTSIIEDVDIVIQNGDIEVEAYYRIGKSNKKTSSKKTFVPFANRFN